MCEEVRVALSARLDGEEPGQPAELIDTHLYECGVCQEWQSNAVRLTRQVRVQPARVPDLTDTITAALAADAPQRPARPAVSDAEVHARRQILRVAVAVAAVVQFALALPALLDPTGTGIHASREMASFDLAVAVGFLVAAYRPARARAYVPVAIVLALCLAVTSGIDVARGATVFSHEIGHLVAVVQAALLWGLGRADRIERGGRGRRAVGREVTT